MLVTAFRRATLNRVMLSRLLGVLSQLSIVFAAPFILEAAATNELYRIIAWASIIAVFSSFGANAAMVKFVLPLEELARKQLFCNLLVAKVVTSGIFSLGLLILDLGLNTLWLFAAASMLTLNFIDYVAEAYGSKEVQRLAAIKIPILIFVIFIKLVMLKVAPNFLAFALYIEWPIIWLAYIWIGKGTITGVPLYFCINILGTKIIAELFTKSIWIWVSGIVQLGWTRGLFIFISITATPTTANGFFLIVRIIEGFQFIPNAVATQFFPILVRSETVEEQQNIRKQFLSSINIVAILIAIVSPIIMAGLAFFSNSLTLTPFSLMLMALIAFTLTHKVVISREIILQDILYSSLVSYIAGAIANILLISIYGVQTINVIMLGYLAFVVVNFFTPITICWTSFHEYRKSLR